MKTKFSYLTLLGLTSLTLSLPVFADDGETDCLNDDGTPPCEGCG